MVCKYCYSENVDVFVGVPARNNGSFEYEKYIHRTFYPCIIHPFSRFRVYWEVFIVIHIFVRITAVASVWAAFSNSSWPYQVSFVWFHSVSAMDLMFWFFTGYVESSTDTVVLDPKKIAVRYITTFFIFDFIATVPFDYLILKDEYMRGLFISHNCIMVVPSHIACSMGRAVIFVVHLLNLTRVLLWNWIIVGLVIIITTMVMTIVFASNFYLCQLEFLPQIVFEGLESLSEIERFYLYLDILLLLVLDCLFFDLDLTLESDLIKIIVLSVTFIGTSLFTAFFIIYVIVYLNHHQTLLELESEAQTFIAIKRFNNNLRNKTILYFHILLENKYAKDYEIFDYIPDPFKGDIFYYLCLPLLKNFYCFDDLPTYVLRRLAESLNYQLYLPNEVVMSKEEFKLRMYFVHRGTVAYYSSKSIELYHFETGSNFNGKNLVLGQLVNNNYAMSIEVTEVYRLNYEDFMDIMGDTPQLYQKMIDKLESSNRDNAYLVDY